MAWISRSVVPRVHPREGSPGLHRRPARTHGYTIISVFNKDVRLPNPANAPS